MKTHSADLLAQVNRERRPVIITQEGEARGVLMDPDSFEHLRDAIGILKLLVQGEEAVRLGRTVDQDTLFRRLGASLRRRGERRESAKEP